jgi:hypothetical protein
VGSLDQWQPTDPRANDDPYPIGISLIDRQTRVFNSELGRGQSQMNEAITLLDLLPLHELGRFKVTHFPSDPGWIVAGVELGDRTDATSSIHETLPSLLGTDPQRRNKADAGDYNSPV